MDGLKWNVMGNITGNVEKKNMFVIIMSSSQFFCVCFLSVLSSFGHIARSPGDCLEEKQFCRDRSRRQEVFEDPRPDGLTAHEASNKRVEFI